MNNNDQTAGINGVTVYGASSSKINRIYLEAAYNVGRILAQHGIPVISGGGRGGIMEAAIDGAISADGVTVGVLPGFMVEREWNHPGLSRTIVTDTMHERKATMAAMSRGVIAMPGGVGTLDELFEIITWRQLKLYKGNVVICNIGGFYDPLLTHLAHTADEGFMRKGAPEKLWSVATTPEEAVEMALAVPSDPGIQYHLP
ncbi:MAG: TIGR00730 family Rossman fold protein [Muribaculum sp.]|nr:TIGR00730 family Rossman fold protein [Muribaculum sp.]